MAITPFEFFYDAQQRRFLEQIVRAFSVFQYQTGLQGNGQPQLKLVPCHMAMSNPMVANIQSNLSENALLSVPQITIWQTGLRGRSADLQNPAFIDTRQVFERNISNGKYGPNRGNAYNVERIMPLPFTMEVQVDIWTSNLEQKYQLGEQILTAMWPEFQIQNSENALDWSAVTVCFVDDEVNWSSRTVPIGGNEDADIMTIRLRLPIWLTAPAKIRRLTRIEEIVANVGDKVVDPIDGTPSISTLYDRVIVTPGDYCISVDGNVITLLSDKGADLMTDGTVPSWTNLFNLYGLFAPNVTELRLFLTNDIEGAFVAGTLNYGTEPNQLIWTMDVDTLPSNTLPPVDAVIDPQKTFPGQVLPAAAEGTRYLLVNDIGASTVAWGSLEARTNDIIQYSSGSWAVSFDSATTIAQQYVLNLHTGRQLRWDGREWVMTIGTFYGPGLWRLTL